MSEYAYVANATLDDGTEVTVDLEQRGWADKEMLGRAVRWSLVPKGEHITLQGHPYPLVTICIPQGAKPIFRSRVYRSIIQSRSDDQRERKVIPHLLVPEFRAYCIGWKKGRLTVWTWVLPNGSVETGTSDDSHLGFTLRAHLDTLIREEPEPVEEDSSVPARMVAHPIHEPRNELILPTSP
jgi:hypothetical protein